MFLTPDATAVIPIHSAKLKKREAGDRGAISTYYGGRSMTAPAKGRARVLDLVPDSDGRIGTVVIFTTKYFGFVKETFEVPFSWLQVKPTRRTVSS